jgi:AsmA family protein
METGVVHNEYIDLIAADLLNNLVPGGDDSGRTQLNCLVARFDVEDGVATSRALLFDTALTTTAGGGIIDLGKEEADLTIKPRPKDASLLSLAVPISVYGPLTDLGFTLKKEEAILGLAGALLGSALLGPVGLIVPFVSAGAGDGNACVEAVERPVEPETKAQDGAASPIERITDDEAVEDMVEDLINIFD